MNKITKAVIPVAGKGTRFLPVTKAVTKTLFPIINKPTIHYLVEEVVHAGINEIIIVINNKQRWIKDYFDNNSSYYEDLHKKVKELQELEALNDKINIKFVIQLEPRGLGHAILCAKRFVGSDDFAVLLGDDLVQMGHNPNYGIKDLVKEYQKHPAYYIGVIEVPKEDTCKYGIVAFDEINDNSMHLTDMVEKPQDNPPSNYAACGRYVLKNSVFKYLSRQHYKIGQEIQLTDAISEAIKLEDVYARKVIGKRFDIGSHVGYVRATIAYAMADSDMRKDILGFVKDLEKEYEGHD